MQSRAQGECAECARWDDKGKGQAVAGPPVKGH